MITRDELTNVATRSGVITAEALAEFVAKAIDAVPPDVGTVVSAAFSFPDSLWHNPIVRDAIGKGPYAHHELRSIFELMACDSLDGGLQNALDELLASTSDYLLGRRQLFDLVYSLHRRRLVDVRQLLLSRLRWYSNAGLWENAILIFRVCAPEALLDKHLIWTATVRSAVCRALLRFLSAGAPEGGRSTAHRYRRAAIQLRHLDNQRQLAVVLDLTHICVIEGPVLAYRAACEMVKIGDYRNIEFLTSFVGEVNEPGAKETLINLAACSNEAAARWARALLDKK